MDKLYIIKIGGNVIDDEKNLSSFLADFANIDANKILVHGGGKMATRMAEQLNIPQSMVDGRRITDSETLKIITMVYAGYINKNIVARLQSLQCNAIGMSGADGNMIRSHKREKSGIDYGFAGDVDEINSHLLHTFLQQGLNPVIAPVTHDKKGQLLNTNADTIAQELAKSLASSFSVELIYAFEKEGVMLDVNDPNSVLKKLGPEYYRELRSGGTIFAGMIPKLDNAFNAIESGVSRVVIGRAEDINELVAGTKGTSIVND